jgi:probable HAF family extracellular repeat protein
VTGWSYITGNFAEHAFRYDGTPGSGGVMRDLGTLGGTNSKGYGVNDAGQVAGHSLSTGNTAYHAFRYDGTPGSGGVMRDLGTLGGTSSFGSGINDAGQVVGTSDVAGNAAMHAFLYTGTPGAGGQMIDLDDWLDTNIPTEGAKWTLAGPGASPSDISNTGWITGTGIYDPDGPGGVANDFRAYLLDASSLVPEPSLMGDFDADGDVDAADLLEWQGDFGQNGLSDADSDDDSDGADFLAWQQQLGSAAPAVSANASIPEPATSMLVIVAGVAICRIGGRVRQELIGRVEKEHFVGFGFGLIFCLGSGLWSRFIRNSSVLQEGGRHAGSACIRSQGQGEHRLGVVRRRGPLSASDRPRPGPGVRPGIDRPTVRGPAGSALDRSGSLLPHAVGGLLPRDHDGPPPL